MSAIEDASAGGGRAARRPRVAVLMGGRSAEREVSLSTGEQVATALEMRDYSVERLDARDQSFILRLMEHRPDVVFVCLHGRWGEDGTVQGVLEILDIPYVGSGVLASALAMDKVMSKRLFNHAGIPTPAYVHVRADEECDLETLFEQLGGECVVKPSSEGSALGTAIVREEAALGAALEVAFRYDGSVLVERFIAGVEVTVGVIGNDEPVALPTLEIVPEREFYDYESKYVPGMSAHIIPARVDTEAAEECQRIALAAHQALGCRGMSRADMIVAKDGVWLLETNTIPGMTPTSLLPDAARAAGIDFPDLCEQLVKLALE